MKFSQINLSQDYMNKTMRNKQLNEIGNSYCEYLTE